jgi:hypothetical protein
MRNRNEGNTTITIVIVVFLLNVPSRSPSTRASPVASCYPAMHGPSKNGCMRKRGWMYYKGQYDLQGRCDQQDHVTICHAVT